mgnify:CR=1 FL=1
MRLTGSILLLLGVVTLLGGCSSNATVSAASQTTCPVMGGEINKDLYYDHFTTNEEGVKGEGKRIYYCCPGCLGAIKAAPENMVEKLETQGVTLEKVTACCNAVGTADCCDKKDCPKDCASEKCTKK